MHGSLLFSKTLLYKVLRLKKEKKKAAFSSNYFPPFFAVWQNEKKIRKNFTKLAFGCIMVVYSTELHNVCTNTYCSRVYKMILSTDFKRVRSLMVGTRMNDTQYLLPLKKRFRLQLQWLLSQFPSSARLQHLYRLKQGSYFCNTGKKR